MRFPAKFRPALTLLGLALLSSTGLQFNCLGS